MTAMRALIALDPVPAWALKESGTPEIDQTGDGFQAIKSIRETTCDLIRVQNG